MSASKIIRASLALLAGIAATVSGHDCVIPADLSNFPAEEVNVAWPETNQDTLRLVTVVMRHGERAPADTYPNDPHVNDTMEPFGWGQLTNKGRRNVYLTGLFMRRRYGGYLGDTYSPHKFWLQTSSIDRAKITGSILSAALWKPNGKQAFSPYAHWQPVSLHYWERPEDRLLIIWNACPRLTLERMQVENSTKVRLVNSNNKRLYKELSNRTGLPMNGAADIASLYSTLKAEVSMELSLPEWTKEFFPGRLESIACFSLSMNVFTDNLRKLAGGPLVTKIVKSMIAKSLGKLKPEERKMFVFVGHDSTLVNMLSAMKVWNGQDPDFGCMIMIELHEICGTYYVQIFQKNLATEEPYSLAVPDCGIICPLDKFVRLMEPVIVENYDADCRVDDPHYAIPPQPPA
ncbi:venom acid phosphatase Acph-1-like isoform X2 [Venturia canescens]|uniref:venom acid phosphatase Acph-1-like isoform X2 n=1 Tax=Venturia canescens TaxID=32260 RepID=UPI001C9C4CDA|nr:venom acid phosphatase Acph-1-like isoform X2 [Venturia canescens]